MKFRRRGRHTAPSQVEKVAEKAGKAAPAMAIAGALVAADWQWLAHENAKTVSDPNLIYPGQSLFVPADPPANYTLPSYVPKHAAPATPVTTTATPVSHTSSTSNTSSGGGGNGGTVDQSAPAHSNGNGNGSGSLSGTLSCSGLEQLWDSAGGNPSDAFMAAEIAMAESGGNQYALSPTDDYGYWQINASNGALATFNAYGNARSAIILSQDGANWSPWTTYTSGAYAGRC